MSKAAENNNAYFGSSANRATSASSKPPCPHAHFNRSGSQLGRKQLIFERLRCRVVPRQSRVVDDVRQSQAIVKVDNLWLVRPTLTGLATNVGNSAVRNRLAFWLTAATSGGQEQSHHRKGRLSEHRHYPFNIENVNSRRLSTARITLGISSSEKPKILANSRAIATLTCSRASWIQREIVPR